MEKALILGRFEPFHKMHLGLTQAIKALGYEIVFGVFLTSKDRIHLEWRNAWLNQIGEVRFVEGTYDGADPEKFQDISLVAGSNPELKKVAHALNVPHFLWDPAREAWDLDAEEILADPVKHWYDMPWHTRKFAQKRITFVGPESVGKSWFARKMAKQFGGPHIPEYGRPHEKHRKKGDYSSSELIELARRHSASRAALSCLAGPVIFEDTDELMTAVWSEMLLETFTPEVEALIKTPDIYILYHWDTPWELDQIRYFARTDLRRKFYELIEHKLREHAAHYITIGGTWEERETATLSVVNDMRDQVRFEI